MPPRRDRLGRYRVVVKQTVTVEYEVDAYTIRDARSRMAGFLPFTGEVVLPESLNAALVNVSHGAYIPEPARRVWPTPEQRVAAEMGPYVAGQCREWLGTRGSSGYGQVCIDYKLHGAHRIVWETFVGPIPPGMQVCHRCDNPPCVNWQDHLFLGSIADNQHDKGQKGRAARGTRNGGGKKLTESQVREIAASLTSGDDMQALADRYGVSRQMIRYIRDGVQWWHVTGFARTQRASRLRAS